MFAAGFAEGRSSAVFGSQVTRLLAPSLDYTRGNARPAPPAIELPSGIAEEKRPAFKATERAKSRSFGVEKVRDRSPAASKAPAGLSALAKLGMPFRPGPKISPPLLVDDDEEGWGYAWTTILSADTGLARAGSSGGHGSHKKPEPS